MDARSRGFARAGAATVGLTAAAIAGAVGLAGLAWAATTAAHSSSSSSSTSSPSSTSSSEQGGSNDSGWASTGSGAVTNTDQAPQSHSGGS